VGFLNFAEVITWEIGLSVFNDILMRKKYKLLINIYANDIPAFYN
jgi:hypothetical protein